jgi:uncharacterized protein YlzI (FlbEa/FlbD family)
MSNNGERMETNINTITINGKEYVAKDSIQEAFKPTLDGKKYVIARTHSAGVFAGYLESENGQEIVLVNARRLWQWAGAASLSQMAMDGTSKPNDCKFPQEVDRVKLYQVIELLDATEKCRKSLAEVKVWKE